LSGSVSRGLTLAAIAGLLVALACALVVASLANINAAYVARSVVIYAGAALVIVGLARTHHRAPTFGAANTVTLLRVALVAGIASLVGEPASAPVAWLAAAGIALVAVLDGVDGWLARHRGEQSAFGARFDMETDAALILIVSLLVWRHEKAGAWVVACGLMRYAFVAAGWVLPWMAGPLRSTLRGKTVAIGQLAGLGAALLPVLHVPLATIVAAITLAALVWSFAVDIVWLKRQAG